MSQKNRAKEYNINNRDNILNRAKQYYINNKESIRGYPKIKDYQKEYRKTMTGEKKQKMKEYQKEYQKEYRKTVMMNKSKDIMKLEINVIKINIVT